MNRNRVPRGVPTGGQFATSVLAESTQVCYVEPRSVRPDYNPNTSGWATSWWIRQRSLAERNHAQGDYPQMPRTWVGDDDNRLHSSHRMLYRNKDLSVRMPSVTSVRKFAGKGEKTFDVPVSAQTPNGNVMGWVRVTHSDDGSWATRTLGMDPDVSPHVAESVHALLEARRPSFALREAGDILERRRNRAATLGASTVPVRSAWIDRVGYNQANETLVMTTKGRNYGYHVPPSVYQALLCADKPGAEFNRLVRNRAPGVHVVECPACHRFSAAIASHRCPVREAPRPGR